MTIDELIELLQERRATHPKGGRATAYRPLLLQFKPEPVRHVDTIEVRVDDPDTDGVLIS